MRSTFFAAAVAAVLSVFVGFGSLQAQDPTPVKVRGDKALITENGDVNADGKPDVWTYFLEKADPDKPGGIIRVLAKKEADLNFDGKKDLVRMYDDTGVLIREEADLDFDGHVDLIVTFASGKPTEKLYYRDKKRVVFIRKSYDEEGKLSLFERDDDLDGKFDYCERWHSGEKISQYGRDTTGDGKCDDWKDPE